MKTAYCYDPNLVFIGTVECRIDPLELEINNKEVHLLPANATFTEVPQYDNETEYAAFADSVWEINKKELPPEPVTLTPEQLRRKAYSENNCITWHEEEITVDTANILFNAYFAEGDEEKYLALRLLIAEAKAVIRSEY